MTRPSDETARGDEEMSASSSRGSDIMISKDEIEVELDTFHRDLKKNEGMHEADGVLQPQRTIESINRHQSSYQGISPVERTQSRGTAKSTRSRLSRVITRHSKKERLERELIPVSDLDNDLVGWENQDDPKMPLNFSQNRKWLLLGLISSITMISPLASSMFAPGVSIMNKDFGNNDQTISSFTVSVFVLGYAVGPLILSPLSEIYGRRPILGISNAFFCVWQLACALAPNIGGLIVFRFFAGVGGSGCLTIGGGVIADLFPRDQRGVATSIYSVGPLLGPVIGPICGGFIAERAGWRWVFWVLFIAGTVLTIGIELLNQETNPHILIDKKTAELRKSLNRPELKSIYTPGGSLPARAILKQGMVRPIRMLFLSPIVFTLALYMAVVYGLLYLLFTTITSVFIQTYGWDPDICGLAYMGLGLGFFVALPLVGRLSDSTVVRMTKANNNVFEPEFRLPSMLFFAFFIPITFFWYGWTTEKHVHWIVPILGLAPFGFGMIGLFMPVQTYVIDSFPEFAASGLAALTTSRSLFGAFLPLAGPKMYESLGLGWGNSILGFIAVALIPVPALLYKYGGKIRKEHPIKL
ncbi:major facilitator superfamily domain-containing protein [Bisporella sp. PMI_857]|nr:major facilitator superfamily domain-containing protein [Bisporella sp. PMI_857]